MKFTLFTAIIAVILSVIVLPSNVSGKRLYIRHRRAIEREGTPSKESTVVVASDSKSDESAATDIPEDLQPHVNRSEKDCNDFFELDYNPRRDIFMFNGHVPNMFRPFRRNNVNSSGDDFNDNEDGLNHSHNMDHIHNMFQQMFKHATRMFNRFPPEQPVINQNFPDNYNGTTEEIVTIDGKKFVKKQHIINKNEGGIQVHLTSITYEEVKDKTEVEGAGNSTVISIDEKNTDKNSENTTGKPNDLTDGTVVQY